MESAIDSIVIYKDNNPSGARTIWITLTNGKVYMQEQDYSPQLEDIFGRDTYERFVSNVSAEDVERILQAGTTENLNQILKKMFGKSSGLSDFRAFLDSNGLPYEFGRY